MSSLVLRFLGAPEAAHAGRTLKFPTQKTLALLAYLAVEGGRHSRESLAGLFWPESDTRRAQASLRNTLTRLRHALGEAQSALIIDEHHLSLDHDAAITLDVRALEVDASHASSEQLQSTLALYRGELLEGFSLPDALGFDDWLSVQRERVHRRLSALFERLTRLQSEAGQLQAGLETANRWAAHDRLNEAAQRRLMELHLATGNRAAALQAYTVCCATLAQELNIEPSPETQALAERIRRDVTAGHRAGSAQRLPLQSELPFVGRVEAHMQLVAAYHAARQGRTQAVVLGGEAGIGKTRMSAEFLAWAAAQGADVLRGRAFEAGGRLPYQALVDALRVRLEDERAPDDLLGDVWLAELSRLLPELRERYADLPLPTTDDAVARTRLLEAVTRLGQALASLSPLVLFVDDLQWADSATLDTLTYSLGRWTEAQLPILCLLTVRAEALATTTTLRDWLSQLERGMPLTRLALGAISATETRQLVERLGASREPRAVQHFGDWLFAETAGQPFFIAETLKALVERGVLTAQSDQQGVLDVAAGVQWLESRPSPSLLPTGVRELIISRVNRLSPLAMNLLTAAAVLGRLCAFEQMCGVVAAREDESLAALDELLDSQLLVKSRDEARPYAVAHDKIRDVVYTEAGDARRRLYHRRALELLELSAAQAELAHHALCARLADPAFRYSVAAGDAAMRLFAVQDAIDAYEQGRLVESTQSPAIAPAQWQHLYTRLGRAYELRGDHGKAEAVYTVMLTRARAEARAAMESGALNRLATLAVHGYAFERARSLFEQALAVAERTNDRIALAETEWGMAQLAHHLFDFQSSRVHSARTLALARELQNPELTAGSLNALGYASMLLGDVAAGEQQMEDARKLYHHLGNRALEADCLTAISGARFWLGRAADSMASARAAHAICREIENPWGEIFSGIWQVMGLVDQGAYEAALAVALDGKRQASAHGFKPVGLFNAVLLAQVYRALMAAGDAQAALDEAAALSEQAQVTSFASAIVAERCALEALQGNWTAAHRHAKAFVAGRCYTTLPLLLAPQWLISEALLRAGDEELARADAQHWGELVASIPRFRIGHLRSLAVLAMPRAAGSDNQPQFELASGNLQEAAALAESLGLPGELWQSVAALGALYHSADREPDAQRCLARASAIARSLAGQIQDERRRTNFLNVASHMIGMAPRLNLNS